MTESPPNPIFEIDGCLVLSIREDIDDRAMLDLQDTLAQTIRSAKPKGVVIDISQLDIVDTFAGRVLGNLAGMASILNARTFLVGMRPAVALTLVELGMTLPGLETARTVSHAMQHLRDQR